MKSPLTQRLGLFLLGVLGLVALLPTAATAGPRDRDRDGLTDKRERKIGTSPRRADTDRDTLKDGREVKRTRTNPLKADTDGDGVRDGREIRNGLNPRDADSDDDGTSDRYERKGTIVEIDGQSVTIRSKRGSLVEFSVDGDTFLEGTDRTADGVLDLGDFRVGDRVEVNLSSDGSRALALELKSDDDDREEAEGRLASIDGETVTVEGKRGRSWTFVVDAGTRLRAPDRDESGAVTLADFQVGDKVEAHLSTDGSRALSLELEYDEDEYGDDDGYGDADDEDEADDDDDDEADDDEDDDDEADDDSDGDDD